MKVLECKGFKQGDFIIPPFTLHQGEILNLCLFGGGHFLELEQRLIDIFTGKIKQDGVEVIGEFQFANRINPRGFKSLFAPKTVHTYLEKYGQLKDIPITIFPDDGLKDNIPLNRLGGDPSKFLSIYSTFSKSPGIIFDFVGNSPFGTEFIFQFVKEYIQKTNGYAIFLNNFTDFQRESDLYLQVRVVK